MRKIVIFMSYLVYVTIAKHCPSFGNSYKGFFERIRYYLVKGYISGCGKCVNIQPKATIARRVEIGDFSGVGRNSLLQGGGDNWQARHDGARSVYLYPKS